MEHLSALSQMTRRHGLHFHCYTDDPHLSLSLYPNTAPTTLLPPQSFVKSLLEIKTWIITNLRKIHCQNTERVVVAPNVLLQNAGNFILQVDGCSISPFLEVCKLGSSGTQSSSRTPVSNLLLPQNYLQTLAFTL